MAEQSLLASPALQVRRVKKLLIPLDSNISSSRGRLYSIPTATGQRFFPRRDESVTLHCP